MMHRYLAFCLMLSFLACSSEETSSISFQLLSPQQTNITFENTITESDSVNLFDYYYIYNGSGVAVGDVNNDDRPDLFFGGSMVSSTLYLNQGKFSFQDVTLKAEVATNAWVMGVTMVDINADDLLDIYVNIAGPEYPNQTMENLLFVNHGMDQDGIPAFKEAAAQYGINDPSFSVQSAFFDYDRDGDLDLYILTNRVDNIDKAFIMTNGVAATSGATIDHLYENIGYVDSLAHPFYVLRDTSSGIAHEGYGLGLAIDDLNQDGWPDIYVANDFMPDEKLYINQHNGRFKESAKDFLPTQSFNGMGVDIADINNDLLPDIIVADMLPNNNDRRKSMLGAMDPKQFNLRHTEGYQAQYVRNTLLLNQGTDDSGKLYLSEVGQLAGVHATDWSWCPLLADFDNDGDRDLYITNGFVKDMTDLDYVNFRANQSYFGTNDAKVEREKRLMDALTEVKIPNFLFQNNGNLDFQDVSVPAGIHTPSFSNGAIYTDLDGDGDLDIVTNEINAPAFVYENHTPDINTFLNITLNGNGLNSNAIGAKLIATSKSSTIYDYVSPTRGYLSSIQGPIHIGLGKDTSLQSLVVQWPDGSQQTLTNIRSNQTINIDYAPHETGQQERFDQPLPYFEQLPDLIPYHHKENTYSDYDRDPLLLKLYSKNGPCISVGTIDDQEGIDLFLGASVGHNPVIFSQDKNGQFQETAFPGGDENYEDMASLLFDFDQDQDNDLYVVSGGSESSEGSPNYQDRLYLNDGKGNFTTSTALPTITASGSCVAGADYDRDGDIDLFVGGRLTPGKYPKSPHSYLLQHDGDRFTDISGTVSGLSNMGMVTSAVWSDYDDDGWLDLLIVGEWMPFTIFRNVNGVLEKMETPIPNSHGWWNVIHEGDFDQDGDMDYVAGNLGHNQDYKATAERPFVLYADDFDQNGKIDPIFACYMKSDIDGDYKLFPFHGRDDLNNQIPAFKKIFQSYQDYSEATIEEVLGSDMIKKAMTLKAQSFSTSLFINKGNDAFERLDLPVEAQLAPVSTIRVEDINQDGILDLILAGNHNNSEHTYGAQNISLGICLLGKGNLEFEAISPRESGLYLNQDIKDLRTFQTNAGDRILVAVVNSGSLISLRQINRKTQ